jgi:hypothetical protein
MELSTMPNATVRADARTLPEATNRRAVLGAVLAAGAAVSLPAVAAASVTPSPNPDAHLLALIERARIADESATDAYMAADNLLGGIRPSYPLALVWNEADESHWLNVHPSQPIYDRDIDWLRRWLDMAVKPDLRGDKDLPLVFPTPEFEERAREIVKTKDEYEAACRTADEHPEVLAAEALREALTATWRELATRVATTPAKTPEGILAKLILIASGYSEDDLDGNYDGVLASAALDAQALAKARILEDA